MQNDKTTLRDLSIFPADGSDGVFVLLDRTTTYIGRDVLRRHIQHPPDTHERLVAVQQCVRFLAAHRDKWPHLVLNGTIVMLDKFFEAADSVSPPPAGVALILSTFFQRLLHQREHIFTQFSLSHVSDFLKGCIQMTTLASLPDVPELLQTELKAISKELKHPLVAEVTAVTAQTKYTQLAVLNYNVRREMKNMILRLMNSYARLDAWQAMGKATIEHGWVFPELLPASAVTFDVQGIYHPLLHSPVAYDTEFSAGRNFMLLTGANMSGKTTYMRALGVGALLAHLGMGVPASRMRISFLQGIITNMQVEDNINKGESYFFAEVQRMKQTAGKLLQQEPHLVLMDELFKGTNVHDAYECTRAVVDGLLHQRSHLMILSTHLYEVAQVFSGNEDIQFAYFLTDLSDSGGYKFTYRLLPDISNDRIGYLILQKEGVIELLQKGNNT